MALFSADIRRDSVSLMRFFFIDRVRSSRVRFRQFFAFNIHTIVFSSHFYFLVIVLLVFVLSVLLLAAVISSSLFLLKLSSSPRIDTSTLSSMFVSTLPPSFLNTYSLYHFSGVWPWPSSSTFLSFGPLVERRLFIHFKNWPLGISHNLWSRIAGLNHKTFRNQSMPWIYIVQ